MFDLLKKKIGGFIDNIVKKKEEPEEEKPKINEPEPPKKEPMPERIDAKPVEQKPEPPKKEEPATKPIPEKPKVESKVEVPKSKPPSDKPKLAPTPRPVETKPTPATAPTPSKETAPKPPQPSPKEIVLPPLPKELPKSRVVEEKPKEEPKAKVGIFKQVTSIFTGEVEINEPEVRELLETLELELLESDVAIEVADEIKNDLRDALVGSKIKRGELNSFVKNTIKTTLIRIVKSEKQQDILTKLSDPGAAAPIKILFLGVNGAGKTTTMAKVAKMLMNDGKTVVFASADTFRAAAIEQLQVHADRLGIRNIKRDYGSDPTAVAYDAVNYAKAHSVDAVLIDTAGRQETDLNLINELKKMSRVIQPDLKLYIGESIAGNAILSQVEDFNKAIGIDGVILTKLDCDAKGGTVLSITKSTGIPIVYVGTGQKYEDLEKFDAEKIIERIME